LLDEHTVYVIKRHNIHMFTVTDGQVNAWMCEWMN